MSPAPLDRAVGRRYGAFRPSKPALGEPTLRDGVRGMRYVAEFASAEGGGGEE
jgi:hypothetical protein